MKFLKYDERIISIRELKHVLYGSSYLSFQFYCNNDEWKIEHESGSVLLKLCAEFEKFLECSSALLFDVDFWFEYITEGYQSK